MVSAEIRNADVSVREIDGAWRIVLRYDDGESYVSRAGYETVTLAEAAALQWALELACFEERVAS